MKKSLIIAVLLLLPTACAASNVDMYRLAVIESGVNPDLHNRAEKRVGLYQVPVEALREYNRFSGTYLTVNDLFCPRVNHRVASWYLDRRLPGLLRRYGREVNTRNVLVAYRLGPAYVVQDRPLPRPGEEYLEKYFGWGEDTRYRHVWDLPDSYHQAWYRYVWVSRPLSRGMPPPVHTIRRGRCGRIIIRQW